MNALEQDASAPYYDVGTEFPQQRCLPVDMRQIPIQLYLSTESFKMKKKWLVLLLDYCSIYSVRDWHFPLSNRNVTAFCYIVLTFSPDWLKKSENVDSTDMIHFLNVQKTISFAQDKNPLLTEKSPGNRYHWIVYPIEWPCSSNLVRHCSLEYWLQMARFLCAKASRISVPFNPIHNVFPNLRSCGYLLTGRRASLTLVLTHVSQSHKQLRKC